MLKQPGRTVTVYDGRGMAHTTQAGSLMEAAWKGLTWWEVDCRTFGTARRIPDDEVLRVCGAGQEYRVRAGRVREWSQKGH